MRRFVGVALVLALGCTRPATQLVVVVNSDYSVPSELSEVRAIVRDDAAGIAAEHTFKLVGAEVPLDPGTFHLPISFAVGFREGDREQAVAIELEAIGPRLAGRAKLFTRRTVTSFIEGETLVLPMFIARRCESTSCEPTYTCTERGCAPEYTDSATLRPTTAGDELTDLPPLPDSGSPEPDAGSPEPDARTPEPDARIPEPDAGSRDAGAPDAPRPDVVVADAGRNDADASPSDARPPADGGVDAGASADAGVGVDASVDAGVDGGPRPDSGRANRPIHLTAESVAPAIGQAGATATIAVDVEDLDSSEPGASDAARVTIDLGAVGGGARQMTPGQVVSATRRNYLSTIRLPQAAGAYLIPIQAQDFSGSTAETAVMVVIATAVTHLVGPGRQFTTLQPAINAAGPGDLVLVDDGVYSGSDNRDLYFGGKAMVLMSRNGPGNAIIQCEPLHRAFTLNNSRETRNTVIRGFTVRGCTTSALLMQGTTSPTLIDMVMTRNRSGDNGGALELDGSGVSPIVLGSIFSANRCRTFGGAIDAANGASFSVFGCRFEGNNDPGGAIFMSGAGTGRVTNSLLVRNATVTVGVPTVFLRSGASIEIRSSRIEENRGDALRLEDASRLTIVDTELVANEGAIIASDMRALLSIVRSRFERNTQRPAIEVWRGARAASQMIQDSVFTGNLARDGSGAAVSLRDSPSDNRISRCTFTDNVTSGDGGAVWASDYSRLVVEDSTFIANEARGASAVWGGSEVRGSIFIENRSTGAGAALFTGNQMLVTNCLFERNFGGAIFGVGNSRILSSTFVDNESGRGGAFHVLAGTHLISDCIMWSNFGASGGDAVYVGTGDTTIRYSDITTTGNPISGTVNGGAGFMPGVDGNLSADPRFVDGPRGPYYLGHVAAGQSMDSPLLSVGSTTAAARGLGARTTRTDHQPDAAGLDLGFHYPP